MQKYNIKAMYNRKAVVVVSVAYSSALLEQRDVCVYGVRERKPMHTATVKRAHGIQIYFKLDLKPTIHTKHTEIMPSKYEHSTV